MSGGPKVIVFPVRNIEHAKAVFGTLLDTSPSIDEPYYVQFDVGNQIIGLDPNGHARGFTGSVGYWEVDDVNVRYQQLLSAGASEHEAPSDVGGGHLIASVKDADGNIIGLAQAE